MARLLRIIATVTALVAAPVVQAQDTSDLTAAQVRALAADLAQQGQFDQALTLIEALLARDPDDVDALFLLTQISRVTEQADAVAEFGARTYFRASDPTTKFASARLVAESYAVREQDTRAMIWLRRARQFAPDDAAAASVAEDFRFLRQRNPLNVELNFGVAPSGNINNGSANSSSELFGLPLEFELSAAAQALSGLSINGGVDLEYRLRETERSLTRASFNLDYQTYALSGSSRAALQEEFDEAIADCEGAASPADQDACLTNVDPVQTGEDFAYGTLEAGVLHIQQIGPRDALLSVGADIGKTWYAGDPYAKYLNLSFSQRVPVGNDQARFSLGYRLTDYLDDPDGTSADARLSVGFGWQRRLADGDQMRFGAGLVDVSGDVRNREYRAYNVSVDYAFADPIAGVQLQLGGYAENRTYDSFGLAGGAARTDDIWAAQATGTFSQVEYFGFQPQVSMTLRRTSSTLDLFDSDTAAVSFDLVSSF